MNRIVVIQSRRRPDMLVAEQAHYTRAVGGDAEIVFKNSLDESESWHTPETLLAGVTAVMMGGSGELDFDGGRRDGDEARVTSKKIVARLRPLIDYLFTNDIPTLGICYGHQIIGESQGVRVLHDTSQNKIGTHNVSLTEAGVSDPLFSTLPLTFSAQYAHKDSLSDVPSGAVVLARGERCNTSALRYGSRIYTMQFHPELTASDARARLENTPGYLPEGVAIESVVRESPEASILIPRFIQLFAAKRRM